MSKLKYKLTLARPVTYQIKVPGNLEENWAVWAEEMNIRVDCENSIPSITSLTVTADQAALHGLLRKLYSLGLPIISVRCVSID